jgi:hypothetical protein
MEIDADYFPSPRNIQYVGGVKITSPRRGRIRVMSRAEDLRKLDSVVDAQIWKEPGSLLEDPAHSADVLGYYICTGKSFEDVFDKLLGVYPHFLLETENV